MIELLKEVQPTNYLPLVSGFGGAVLGSFCSLLIANLTHNRQLVKEDNQRIEREKTAAIQTLLKITQIANSVYTIRGYFKEAGDIAAKESSTQRHLYRYMKPIIGFSVSSFDFTAEELTPYIKSKKANVVNAAYSLANRHAALCASMKEYITKDRELQSFAAPYLEVVPEHQMPEAKIPQDKVGPFQALECELSSLFTIMRQTSEDLARDANQTIENAKTIGRDYFNDDKFFTLVPLSTNDIAATGELKT
jgi:hypothetical protein